MRHDIHMALGWGVLLLIAVLISVSPVQAGSSAFFSFNAVALTNKVILRWTDPLEYGYGNETVHIRYSTETYPESFDDGEELYKGSNEECVFMHTNLASGVSYFYTIWTSNDGEYFFQPLPNTGFFLIIDLSGGPSASQYPFYTTNAPPEGGWTDDHKTTQLVLRRIRADRFAMGSPSGELGRTYYEKQRQVTLTNRYYMGVFPVTQRQWERVMGTWPSYFSNVAVRDARPVERVSYDMIRGSSTGSGWPAHRRVDANSFVGRLRARTGLPFDLPTEAQWENAARARSTAALQTQKNLTSIFLCPNMSAVGRYWYNSSHTYSRSSGTGSGTAPVGSFPPNDWGLYDIHGNVYEWCLDWFDVYPPNPGVNPKGPSSGWGRVLRGGSWMSYASECRLAHRHNNNPYGVYMRNGLRVALYTDQLLGPIIALTGELDFGEVFVGWTNTLTMTIHNNGDAPLTVTGLGFPGGFSGDWSGIITPGASQPVTISFHPTEVRPYDGLLIVHSDAARGENEHPVSGIGEPPPLDFCAVLVPTGTNSGTDPDFGAYSLTVHGFYMDCYGITRYQWQEVYTWAITNGYEFCNEGTGKGVNHPVHTVNWYDAVKWSNARSEMEGFTPVYTVDGEVYRAGTNDNVVQTDAFGYRLPTEDEWEYAARGGAVSRRFPWDSSDEIQHARANYWSSSTYSYDTSPTRQHHPTYNDGVMPYTALVDSFAPNGYGLYNMVGNVAEWGFDWDPSHVGSFRFYLGGAWNSSAYRLRVGNRDCHWPHYADHFIGFRTVRTMPGTHIVLLGDLDFGNVATGETNVLMLTVLNDGDTPLTVTGLDVPEGFSADWSGVIAPGESNEVAVSFHPTEEHVYSGMIVVYSDAASGEHEHPVSGTGFVPPLDFCMVLIPGGTNSGTDPDFGPYSLTVSSFYMDCYGVTKHQWDVVYSWAITNGYEFCNEGSGKGPDHPVQMINWYDSVKWCNARSEMEGLTPVYTVDGAVYRADTNDNVVQTGAWGYRLPTAAEWEYAARGGLQSKRFPWGNEINHDHANYRANRTAYDYDTSPYTEYTYHPDYTVWPMPYTSPVGSFPPNGYGLYDMAGNARDWCFDLHPLTHDWGLVYRVQRGGGWGTDASSQRVGDLMDLNTASPADRRTNGLRLRPVLSALP